MKLKIMTIGGHADVLGLNLANLESVTGDHWETLPEYTIKPAMRHIKRHGIENYDDLRPCRRLWYHTMICHPDVIIQKISIPNRYKKMVSIPR